MAEENVAPNPENVNSVPEKPKKKNKKKRLRGFAGMIEGQLAPLNTSKYFKEKYGEDNYDIFIDVTDDNNPALVHVADGSIVVEGVKRKDEETYQKVRKSTKARITTDFDTLMGVIMGKVNPAKAVLKRKLKIKGFKKVLQFVKYFKVLSYIQKHPESE